MHQRLDHSIVMRAQRDIRQGEEVTNRYTAIFQVLFQAIFQVCRHLMEPVRWRT